jgi:DUF438 domain-containing protein
MSDNKPVNRPHQSPKTIINSLFNMLGGFKSDAGKNLELGNGEADLQRQYDKLTKALIEKERAWAEYRKASQNLHQEMNHSITLLTSLTYLLYGTVGRKSPLLGYFGIRPHRKPGPKKKRVKKEKSSEEQTTLENE